MRAYQKDCAACGLSVPIKAQLTKDYHELSEKSRGQASLPFLFFCRIILANLKVKEVTREEK
ncbi:hypothetical protein [Lactobacillus delbrueckii]|uniref:hypothetical protein n=1 Tax=Lactobacillus delbrueckii TaxID=1584 RepID=UPI003A89046E